MNAYATLDAALRKALIAPTDRNERLLSMVHSAAANYKQSRMELGRVLTDLRNVVHHGHWAATEQALAHYLDVEPRTVRELIHRYREAMKLPPMAVEEMEARELDPTTDAGKKVVQTLLQDDLTDPVAAVDRAISKVKATKAASVSAMAHLTKDERIVLKFREKVLPIVANLPTAQKLPILKTAFEEMLTGEFGDFEPFTVSPRQPMADLPGKKRPAAIHQDQTVTAPESQIAA